MPARAGWMRWLMTVALVGAAGCTERLTVVEISEEPPPEAAAGFLGYSQLTEGRPVCGGCHVGQNAEWRQTAHAHAWSSLQESGHAAETCEGCHTVGARGNHVETVAVGWTATGDPRYQDVQCESCHGPGLQHVTDPDASQPLASIEVGPDATSGCGECHTGAHNPFVEEWAASRHGRRTNFASTRDACVGCHEARGALDSWGVSANFTERQGHEDVVPITCAVCHDPHDATNPRQLRFPIDVPSVEGNLCMKCHHKRAVPDLARPSYGPHSPQGPLLLGTDVGWIPPNFAYEPGSIVATHGTGQNPRLCAGCHVMRSEFTDPATGEFLLNASGHLFKAIPCVNAAGLPTASEDCAPAERTYRSCTAGGCHGSEDAVRSVLGVVRIRLDALETTLNALLEQVPAGEFNDGDGRLSTAEGARFNAQLAAQPGSAIHNPFLVEALLTASIRQVRAEYAVDGFANITLENVLGR
ncbi:MAG: multiheme c-type cytochrome [Gemmatimonadota bacterium]